MVGPDCVGGINMSDLSMMIDNTKNIITGITELLYQQKPSEALVVMDSMLNAITELSVNLSRTDGIPEEDKGKLVVVLGEALSAMEKKDYVLLADILQYDMTDLLDEYNSIINE